jgi:hypothetical protein
MEIGGPDFTASRKQAWIGLLLLSAALAGAGWFGTVHQSTTERHAYARCAAAAGSCARPDDSPATVFAVIAVLFVVLAVVVAVRRDRSRTP